MKDLPRARLIALGFLVAFTSLGAHAGAVTPGQALQSVQPPRAMPVDNTVQLPELIGATARPGAVPAGGPPIDVQRIEFTGNTKVATATLEQRVAQHLGKRMTLAELYAVATDLTRFYQSQGYPLASVNVPVQRVANGRVLLEVTEGRIGKVRIEKQGGFYRAEVLQNHLSELRTGEVVTAANLEREILLLNDLPGIEARLVVVPGEEGGTSDIVVQVFEDAFAFYAGADNHGREDIGQNRLSFNMYVNGLGRGDDFIFNFTRSEDGLLNYGRVAYSLPIGTDGGRFGVSYLLSDYENADPAFLVLEPAGMSSTIRGEYTFPLERSRLSNKVLVLGLATTETQSEALGVITDTTEITLFDITLFNNKVLGDRRTVSWSYGFSGNGEFNNSTPADEGEQCCKLQGDVAATFPVGQTSYQRIKLRAAWSPDTVSDIDRFSLGGPYSVRGYEASEVRGDSGYDASWEFHMPFGIRRGRADWTVFADVGQVSSHVPGGSVDSDVLGALGTGFSIYDLMGFDLNLQYATAVGGYDPADGERDRFYVSIGTRF